ncbi:MULTISPECIES: antibiotic biosynthesis monooxygenase family protein [Actinosynnema]|uniref:antibiotic biosynthesis monooxygenase family protein n=1 Tax=Actinosynnema TaxID=40566 RepID=UPI0020A61699|nr:antibiotic biosynthesis monooxygenase family protein [Actinosynnema pretiosum]MCP2093043.1 Antibiotic biosynthesis monooxygenase [Actinosynnema pretiosum]
MLLVCRFDVPEEAAEQFTARAAEALALLTAQPGCLRADLARSMDEPDRYALTAEFESVVAYRRALSPFPVREAVVPLLSEAIAEQSGTYEPLLAASGGEVDRRTSLVASDAFTVRLGEAAEPSSRPR